MNKFKINILAVGAAGLLLSSCSDSFLDTEQKTSTTTGNFYKTTTDAYLALVGCYDGWQCTSSNGNFAFYVASEVMSDECFGATGNTDGKNYQVVDRFDIAQSSSEVNIFNGLWEDYYAGIYRCNQLITNEDNISWDSEAVHGTYMGECRALRAIMYFDMVRLWGNIPLLEEPTTDNLPQADASEVYKLIVSDLKYAAENIPANAYPKANSSSNDGHITKYAAEALLGRVYLYATGYYENESYFADKDLTKDYVLTALEDVISSKEYSLISEFKNLWPAACKTPLTPSAAQLASSDYTASDYYGWATDTYAGDGNSETILAQKFNTTQDYNGNSDGNRWLVMMGVRNLSSSPYGKGWGACTVNPKFFQQFDANDSRRNASVINIEDEGISALTDFAASKKDQREYTGYTVKKYTPLAFFDGTSASKADGSGDFQIAQHQDFVVMRYADVLLMAAELGSTEAQTYFNMVRERAYTVDGALSPSYAAKSVSKENIMKERQYEFAFEGLRYWDLLRQGVTTAANTIALSIQASDNLVFDGGNAINLTIESQNIIAKKGLSQIPNTQISLSNNVLTQNQGW